MILDLKYVRDRHKKFNGRRQLVMVLAKYQSNTNQLFNKSYNVFNLFLLSYSRKFFNWKTAMIKLKIIYIHSILNEHIEKIIHYFLHGSILQLNQDLVDTFIRLINLNDFMKNQKNFFLIYFDT